MRFAFACAILGVALLNLAAGQNCPDPARSCDHDLTFDKTKQPDEFAENLDNVQFYPEEPGVYELQYRAENLCHFTTSSVTVNVRCPPPPTVVVNADIFPLGSEVLQNQVVQFRVNAAASVGISSSFTYDFNLTYIEGTKRTQYQPMQSSVSNGFTTSRLTKMGDYELLVVVNDGCSSVQKRFCFRVRCNCGPTANAGATQTIWTNAKEGRTVASTSNQMDNREFNSKAETGRLEFILDGTMSDDFDLRTEADQEKLTYDWSILEWIPDPAMAAPVLTAESVRGTVKPSNVPTGTWNVPTLSKSTTGQYRVTYVKTGLDKSYLFYYFPPLDRPGFSECSTETQARSGCGKYKHTDYTPTNTTSQNNGWLLPDASNVYQNPENFQTMNWPENIKPQYLQTYNNTDPTTTSKMAYLQFSTSTNIEASLHYNVTETAKSTGAQTKFCQIYIRQQSSADPRAYLSIENPNAATEKTQFDTFKYYGTHGAFEVCRGLWKFRLLVKDQCSDPNAGSTDDIMLTIRCNRPPVAIAGCTDFVMFRRNLNGGVGFDQVTIDARMSRDEDNHDELGLTYFWSFDSVPTAYTGRKCNSPLPCEQEYCQLAANQGTRYKTCVYRASTTAQYQYNTAVTAFGHQAKQGSPCPQDNTPDTTLVDYAGVRLEGNNDQSYPNCGLHVYPVVYDIQQSNRIIQNTEFHRGNSAYFKPTVQGTYTVKLQVFDGCSMTQDTVSVVATCPELTASVTISGAAQAANMQYSPTAGANTVPLDASVSYADSFTALTYSWSYYTDATCTGGKTPLECCASAAAPTAGSFTPVRNQLKVNFEPRDGKGVYTFCLQIEDGGCQTRTFFSQKLTVTCNNPPTGTIQPTGVIAPIPAATQTGDFPVQTLSVTSADVDGDAVSYSWKVEYCNTNNCGDSNYKATNQVTTANQPLSLSVRLESNANALRIFEQAPATGNNQKSVSYRVTAVLNDGCSSPDPPVTKILTYTCQGRANPAITAVPADSSFDYAVPAFQPVKLTATLATGQTYPYPQRNEYTWCVKTGTSQSTVCAAGDYPTSCPGPSGANKGSDTCNYTPRAEGQYTAVLSISDGCSKTERVQQFRATCQPPQKPTANLKLTKTKTNELFVSSTSPTAPTLLWDSYKNLPSNKYTGGFPDLTASGADSSRAAEGGGQNLYYYFSRQAPGSTTATAFANNYDVSRTVSITSEGTWAISLEVLNGGSEEQGCRSSKVTLSFNAQCLTLSPTMRMSARNGITGATAITSTWNGLSFEDIHMDASGPQLYGGIAATRGGSVFESGNLHTLQYEWLVVNSPPTSRFRKSEVKVQPVVRLPNENQAQRSEDNSTHNIRIQPYERKLSTVTQTTRTTLFNRHYNLPMAGFRPDVLGAYEIRLTITDGCTSRAVSGAITASCPSNQADILRGPPTLYAFDPTELTGRPSTANGACIKSTTSGCAAPKQFGISQATTSPNVMTLDGKAYRRVLVDGRSSISTSSGRDAASVCSTLTYEWTLTGPDQGALTSTGVVDLTATELTNSRGNVASFVPRKRGEYTLTFKACRDTPTHSFDTRNLNNDKNMCQECDTQTVKVIINCVSSIVLPTPTAEVVGQKNGNNDIYYLKNSINKRERYGKAHFLLKGGAKPEYPNTCNVLKRQWSIEKRTCAAFYQGTTPPPVAPPAATCDTTIDCRWNVKSFPCGWEQQSAENGWTKDSWVRNCADEGCRLQNTATGNCVAEFHCQRPGSYTLQLTVNDGCNTRTEDTTVVCKCAKTLAVQTPVVPNVLKTCNDGSTTREFRELTLEGRILSDPAGRVGAPLPACPAPALPTPPTRAPAPTGGCCPALIPCPACKICPECATCPGGYTLTQSGSADEATIPGAVEGAIPLSVDTGAADVPVAPASIDDAVVPGAILEANAVPGMRTAVDKADSDIHEEYLEEGSAFISDDEEEDEVSTSLLLGVVIPISIIIIASMIGNVLLFNKLRKVAAPALPA